MNRFRVELPVDDITIPGEGDEFGNVSFFLPDDPSIKERHEQTGLYFSMNWAHWLSLDKPTVLILEIGGK